MTWHTRSRFTNSRWDACSITSRNATSSCRPPWCTRCCACSSARATTVKKSCCRAASPRCPNTSSCRLRPHRVPRRPSIARAWVTVRHGRLDEYLGEACRQPLERQGGQRRVVARGGDRHSLLTRHDAAQLAATPLARTAIVMPLYHESVERSLAGLRAIYVSLQETGALDHIEIFIMSGSRDPEVWLEEQAAWYRLCRELNAAGHIHYRRRTVHLRHKSGNVADFLRRWGDDYDYFMVLDADSLASGESLVRMVRIMEREPQAGILQTNPAIMNARSAFARIQQFASRAYGGIFAAVS